MGTSSALSNRIAIARNNVFPTIQIAPQVRVLWVCACVMGVCECARVGE